MRAYDTHHQRGEVDDVVAVHEPSVKVVRIGRHKVKALQTRIGVLKRAARHSCSREAGGGQDIDVGDGPVGGHGPARAEVVLHPHQPTQGQGTRAEKEDMPGVRALAHEQVVLEPSPCPTPPVSSSHLLQADGTRLTGRCSSGSRGSDLCWSCHL